MSPLFGNLLYLVPFLVPVLLANGETWPRNARFLAAMAGAFLALDVAMVLFGLQTALFDSATPAAWLRLYDVLTIGAPAAALMLFVGRRPNVFWTPTRAA